MEIFTDIKKLIIFFSNNPISYFERRINKEERAVVKDARDVARVENHVEFGSSLDSEKDDMFEVVEEDKKIFDTQREEYEKELKDVLVEFNKTTKACALLEDMKKEFYRVEQIERADGRA